MRYHTIALAAGLLMSTIGHGATPAIPDYIQKAVADAARPATDTQRDVNRKPAEVLAFAGVKPGDKVGELLPGRGYFTQLFCRIVGDNGQVHTVSFSRPANAPSAPDMPAGMDAGMDAGMGAMPPMPEAPKPPCNNLSAVTKPAAEFALPGGLDMVWTSENYHDFNGPGFGVTDMVKFNKVIFDALKPGGVYMVEDHAAQTGSGTRDVSTLHRIDPEQVKKDVTAAGFVFDSSSDVLVNPADPLNVKTFDLGGKSSKFLLKFRKPR